MLVEAVRFELTEPFGSSVFKTGAISQALPHFQFGSPGWDRTTDKRINSPLLYR